MKIVVATVFLLVAAVASVSAGSTVTSTCQNAVFTDKAQLLAGPKQFQIGDHPDGGLGAPLYCLRLDYFQGQSKWTASCNDPENVGLQKTYIQTQPFGTDAVDVKIVGQVWGGRGSTKKCFDVNYHMGGCSVSGSGTSTVVTCAPDSTDADRLDMSYIKECGADISTATVLTSENGDFTYDFKIKFGHRGVSSQPSGYGWITSTGQSVPGSLQYIDEGSRRKTKDWLFVIDPVCSPSPSSPAPGVCNRYRWDWRQDCPGCGGSAVDKDQIGNVVLQFDEMGGTNPTDSLYLAVTFKEKQKNGQNPPSGFWIVISDGENPKGDYAEYFMIYVCSGSTKASFYVYNGENKVTTYKSSNSKFGSPIFVGAVDVTRSVDSNTGAITYSFTADHTVLFAYGLSQLTSRKNNGFPNIDLSQWDGARFGNMIGVWFHTFGYEDGNVAQYCQIDQTTGKVINIKDTNNSWMDYRDKPASKPFWNCEGPAPAPIPPPLPPCDGIDCCGNCDDQCHNPPAANPGMACMSTGMNSFKCTYTSNTNKLYLDGDRIMNPNAGSD